MFVRAACSCIVGSVPFVARGEERRKLSSQARAAISSVRRYCAIASLRL